METICICIFYLTLAILWSICQEESLFFPRGMPLEEGEWEEEEEDEIEFPKQRSVTSPPLLESFNRSTLTTDSLTSAKRIETNGPVEIQIMAEIHSDSGGHSTQPRSLQGAGPVPRSPTREMVVQASSPRFDAGGVGGVGGTDGEAAAEKTTEKTYSLRFSSFRRGADDDTFDDVV